MKNIYVFLVSGILFTACDFNNIYAELLFCSIGGIGIGIAVKRAREKGYEEGFKDGKNF